MKWCEDDQCYERASWSYEYPPFSGGMQGAVCQTHRTGVELQAQSLGHVPTWTDIRPTDAPVPPAVEIAALRQELAVKERQLQTLTASESAFQAALAGERRAHGATRTELEALKAAPVKHGPFHPGNLELRRENDRLRAQLRAANIEPATARP